MTETVLILDNDEDARANTEAHQRQIARRFGIGNDHAAAITEVGGPRLPVLPFEDAPPPAPRQVVAAASPPAPLDHLLLTPSARAGQVRLVRMVGPKKLESWTMAAESAATVSAILQAFSITFTDLRESEDG